MRLRDRPMKTNTANQIKKNKEEVSMIKAKNRKSERTTPAIINFLI